MKENRLIISKLNVVELSNIEIQKVEGGGFWDAAFEVFETVVQYSGLGGALVVGIANGIMDGIEAEIQNNQQE